MMYRKNHARSQGFPSYNQYNFEQFLLFGPQLVFPEPKGSSLQLTIEQADNTCSSKCLEKCIYTGVLTKVYSSGYFLNEYIKITIRQSMKMSDVSLT